MEEFERDMKAEAEAAWAHREWTIQHVLFPAMKLFLKPPNHMANDGTVVQVWFRLEATWRLLHTMHDKVFFAAASEILLFVFILIFCLNAGSVP
jgi:hypothetical protein